MSDNSAIEWTDATWNPVTGCTKVSPGCDNCYAETFAERWRGTRGHHFENGFDVTLRPERIDQPLKWRKPRRVFVNSMSDLFHDDVPTEFIAKVFVTMARTPQHTYQILTKRHGRMRSIIGGEIDGGQSLLEALADEDDAQALYEAHWPLRNVWLGVSVENQKWADVRVPALLETATAVRFLSCEPLLGPVDLSRWLGIEYMDALEGYGEELGAALTGRAGPAGGLHWVIVGGESGPGARPMHPDWARSLRDQCTAAGVPFFLKQLGEYSPYLPMVPDATRPDGHAPDWDRKPSAWVEEAAGRTVTDEADVPDTGSWQAVYRVGKKRAGRELDGRTWGEFPEPVPA